MRKEEKALPLLHQQRYETFKQTLKNLHQTLLLPDATSLTLRSEVTALQQFFRDQLLSLPLDALPSATQQWVQSYQVEMDKQLRLLGMDVLFLQAARQTATTLQRRQQACDRLSTLQRYCEALLEEGEE